MRTHDAYGDREAMKALLPDYKKMIKRTEVFYRAFRAQWYKESKPQGFDVHEIRIGGLLLRMKSALERLEAYCRGEIDTIPELEEPLLPFNYGTYHVDTDEFEMVNDRVDEETIRNGMGIACFNCWRDTVTANLI